MKIDTIFEELEQLSFRLNKNGRLLRLDTAQIFLKQKIHAVLIDAAGLPAKVPERGEGKIHAEIHNGFRQRILDKAKEFE